MSDAMFRSRGVGIGGGHRGQGPPPLISSRQYRLIKSYNKVVGRVGQWLYTLIIMQVQSAQVCAIQAIY